MPTVAALRERADAIVAQVLAENATRWESLSRHRPRARRADGPGDSQPAAARAHGEDARALADRDDAYLQVSALRELFGLDAGTEPDARRGRRRRLARRAASPQRTRLSPMAEAPLRLGTRGSALALAQAKLGRQGARRRARSCRSRPPAQTGAAWPAQAAEATRRASSREIEKALLDGEVDLGVHSAKDLPTELPEGLEIAGVPAREDPRDAYVGHVGSLGEVLPGARIGTSSLRRRAQLLALRPDLEVVELRGNVDTRLRPAGGGRLRRAGAGGRRPAAAGPGARRSPSRSSSTS